MTERVTLITGASAGIGTELARVFASNGHRLALVARRADRLSTLANEIVASGGAAPIIIPCDLEQPDAGDKIAAALTAEGMEVEFVVNNAGFGLFGEAIELDRAGQLGIIAVNIRTMTDLSLRFADSLIRNRGGILNVGSIAGFLPGPGMAVYYASKAYVLSFSEALRRELAPTPGREKIGGTAELGYLNCGTSGAGHFVKMVHNGIEYGIMAAYAEGLGILRAANVGKREHAVDAETTPLRDPEHYQYDLSLPDITEVWRRGSVIASWLLDLSASALIKDPALKGFEGRVSDSGEGRWTIKAAIDEAVPAHVLSSALYERFSSRGEADFADKLLSAMRYEFGGHVEKPAGT